ncbi:hypothetical protein CE195_02020 [Sodalis-like symbiont of Philaenus spumarius]|nr:hypothetical protein CE195_02020 [Sodalis-like symbiont of Philaenus spumarius]
MQFIDMALVQLSANASGVSAVAVYSSLPTRKPGVKEQIVDMAFNGAGVRDTARTLKISVMTLISRTCVFR